MKNSSSSQEVEDANNEPKRMRDESSVLTLKMDQFEATNYAPNISKEDIAAAKLRLEMAPKTLDFDSARELYLDTRILQRRMLQDPVKCKIGEHISMFPWLENVGFIFMF